MADLPWHLVLNDIEKQAKALKRHTNADRIRAMTDEELAEWINNMQADAYNRGMLEDWIIGYPNNYSTWLDWLKQEVNDGKEEKEENQPAK